MATYAVPRIIPPPPARFAHILEERRSTRVMRRSRLRDIINTIAFATNVRQIKIGDPQHRSRRPSPSGGALHAVDILVIWPNRRGRAFRYDPFDHRLLELAIATPDSLSRFVQDVAAVLPGADGALLVLVGDMGRVAAAYDRPESLLWRDAGALIQTLHLTATAYGQAFCPLGPLGGSALEAIRDDGQFTAVGVAVIGTPIGGA
jgi:hypothetical protein